MIRVIQRRLIIPRGDTGVFTIPAMTQAEGAIGVFTIFDPITNTRIFQKQVEIEGENFNISFSHADTVNLKAGEYLWDIKFYNNPILADNKVIDGEEINSYYAAFQAPKCEIRETGDDFLMIEGQPAKIEDLNIILGATEAANAAKVAATEQAGIAATKAEEAAAKLEEMVAAMPTKVSDLIDDSGHYTKPASGIPASDLEETYLTEHQDLSNYVQKTDYATANTPGVIRVGQGSGLSMEAGVSLAIMSANNAEVKTGTNLVKPIVPSKQHTSVFYGLAKAAGSDEKNSELPLGQYTDAAKAAIQAMLDVPSTADIPTNVSELTNDAGYLTEHQDISGKANAADLAAVATSGSYEDLSDKPTIPEVPVQDVQVNGASVLDANGVANIPAASGSVAGVMKVGAGLGVDGSFVTIYKASNKQIKNGAGEYAPIVAAVQDRSAFYGLAKAAGDTTQSQSSNAVGTYTDGAKTAIQQMLDVPSTSAVTSEIAAAIGNINSFDMTVVQELPTQDISTHTIYLVPKTGETNDVYDEYVYINNAWEMVGNTQIDLSNYVQKTDYATVSEAGVVKVAGAMGIDMTNGFLTMATADHPYIQDGTHARKAIPPKFQHEAAFYGLAKAAGDTTQSQSDNAVGTYTTEAKAAIQTMLDVPAKADIPDVSIYATKADTVLETTLSRGRTGNVGAGSIAFGEKAEASGIDSIAVGYNVNASGRYSTSFGAATKATGDRAVANGMSAVASGPYSHAEGDSTVASGAAAYAGGAKTESSASSAFATGRETLANKDVMMAVGSANTAASQAEEYPTWVSGTLYHVGDKVYNPIVKQNFECLVENNDVSLNLTKWRFCLENSDTLFVVGNGKPTYSYFDANNSKISVPASRSNAFRVDWDGNGKFNGDVYVGANADSTGGTKVLCEADFATAQDIQNIINGGAGA